MKASRRRRQKVCSLKLPHRLPGRGTLVRRFAAVQHDYKPAVLSAVSLSDTRSRRSTAPRGLSAVPEPRSPEFARTPVLANLAAISAVEGWSEPDGRGSALRFQTLFGPRNVPGSVRSPPPRGIRIQR